MKLGDYLTEARERIGLLVFNPGLLFEKISEEKDYLKPLFYFAISYLVFFVIITFLENLVSFVEGGLIEKMSSIFMLPIDIIYSVLIGAPMAFGSPFIASAMIHLGLFIFGVRGDFIKTFRIVCYTSIISLFYYLAIVLFNIPFGLITEFGSLVIFVSIPITLILGISSAVHLLILQVKGISYEYNITKKRAFFSIILIPVIIFIIILLFFLLAGFVIYQILDYFSIWETIVEKLEEILETVRQETNN